MQEEDVEDLEEEEAENPLIYNIQFFVFKA